MACMSCGELNKNYKYILYTAIFAFFTNFIFGYTFNDNMEILLFYKSIKHINLSYHIIFHYIFRFIGILILSLIFYKTEQKSAQKQTPTIKNEEESLDEPESSSSIKLIYNDVKEDLNLKINISPLNIFIVLSIMVLQGILEDIFYKSTFRSLDFWMFELPLLSYLSSKEFNFKIYRHHKLAIFTNIFICAPYKIILLIILINSGNIFFKSNNYYNLYLYDCYEENKGLIPIGIIFYLIIMVSRSYAITKIKVFMDLKYISPNKILMIYGIIGILISIIVGTISTFIDCQTIGEVNLNICKIYGDNKSYFENFNFYFQTLNDDIELLLFELIFFFVGIITNFFYMFYYILIIKNLTPIHSIFSNLTYSFLLQLMGYFYENLNKPQNQNQYNNDEDNKDTKEKTDYSFLNLIFLGFITQIIVFFGLLVYLEIIELNFCKLNENLRRYIIRRSIEDYELNKIDKITDNDKEEDKDAINNSNSQNL